MASNNWQYLSEEITEGPRKDEKAYSTTDARMLFKLETKDIANILGYRNADMNWGGGNNLTIYFHNDLEAVSIKKHGQRAYDEFCAARVKRAASKRAREEKDRLARIEMEELQAKQAALRAAQQIADEKNAAKRAKLEADKAAAKEVAGPEAAAMLEYVKCEKALSKIAAEQTSQTQQIAASEQSLRYLKEGDVKLKRRHEAAMAKFNTANMEWEVLKKARQSESLTDSSGVEVLCK
jgi:hypothetical protein